MDRLAVELTVAAPAETVWGALRDPAEIRRWFGWEYGGLDEEIEAMFVSGAAASRADGTVRATGGDLLALEARGEETVVRITRPALAGGSGDAYDEVDEGWLTFAQQLRFALERHPGEDRRTLRLVGHGASPGAPPPLVALGLAGIASVSPGQRYEVTIATGETLVGEVWFRSQHQLGVSVDAYGDGLLVVSSEPPAARRPHGGGTVLITTYELDRASFAALEPRWTGWWRTHYREGG